MIGTIDCSICAAHPEEPIHPLLAFKNSPSSIRLRDVPKAVGDWRITKVYYQAHYPDDIIKSVECRHVGNIWIGTIDGSTVSGKSKFGFSVFADGIDENGNTITGYVLGKGDIYISEIDGSIEPDKTVWYLHYYDTKPLQPTKGDCVVVDSSFEIYDGNNWINSKPTKLSQLSNDTGFITIASVPNKVSQLSNDTGFITSSSVPKKVSQLQNDTGFITSTSVPKKVSQLTNDSGYATEYWIGLQNFATKGGTTLISEFFNDRNYVTQSQLPDSKKLYSPDDSQYIQGDLGIYAMQSGGTTYYWNTTNSPRDYYNGYRLESTDDVSDFEYGPPPEAAWECESGQEDAEGNQIMIKLYKVNASFIGEGMALWYLTMGGSMMGQIMGSASETELIFNSDMGQFSFEYKSESQSDSIVHTDDIATKSYVDSLVGNVESILSGING